MSQLKLVVSYVFFIFSIALFAQKNGTTIYQPAEMQSDLDYLHTTLQLNHPGFYRYTSAKEWQTLFEKTKGQLTEPLSDIAFRMVLRNYIAHVKCGHTQIFPSIKTQKLFAKKKHFVPPFKVIFTNSKILVTKNESNDSDLVCGSEILSINNHSSAEIINRIEEVQNADAGLSSMKNYYGASQFQSFYMAFFGEDSVYNVTLLSLKKDTVRLSLQEKKESNDTKTKTASKSPRAQNALLNQEFASFRICKGDTQAAIMKIRGFQLNNANKFFERAFTQIEQNDIKYLIVDLRGNGGGSIGQATEMLKYLSKDTFSYSFIRGKQGLTYRKYAKQKFTYYLTRLSLGLISTKTETENTYQYQFSITQKDMNNLPRFTGAIFCLVDNGSFSAASFEAAYLKHKANAIVVGQETAGTESGCFAVNTPFLELPKTGNFVRIPHYKFQHHLPVADTERGVLPSIETTITSQTINSENDEDLDLIWNLIFEKN